MIFLEPPKDFHPFHEIAIGFIHHEGKLFMAKRHESKRQGNKWGLPGGKIEKGETPVQAFAREVFEEIGIHLQEEDIKNFKHVFVRYPERDFCSHMFSVDLKDKPDIILQEDELTDFQWIQPEKALALGDDLVLDNDLTIKMFYGL